jgi:hypothetical protein
MAGPYRGVDSWLVEDASSTALFMWSRYILRYNVVVRAEGI